MMVTATAARTVVLAGNPNTGKTTLFNQLTGGRARVGNYPGVTVERHEGEVGLPDLSTATLIDSPGTYSLSARSADEQIALQTVAGFPPGEPPDLVLLVLDATQLQRNLYLALQILELNLPVVVALNMIDVARKNDLEVDAEALARELRVPVVPVAARRAEGLDVLRRAVAAVLHAPERGRAAATAAGWLAGTDAVRDDVVAVAPEIPPAWSAGDATRRDALALWALLSLDDDDELADIPADLRSAVAARRAAADAAGRSIEQEVIEGRYRWIDERIGRVVTDVRRLRAATERIDRVLLHPVLGFALFLGLMTVMFQALFSGADPLIGWIEQGFLWLGSRAADVLPPGLWTDFVVDGLIGGVGAFVVFLPQIALLFLFIGLLEDTGYMARVAVLMDRVMKSVGLHGRAFIPMLSGYACAVPAILATRNMERRRDRLLTMMVIPLMTCSARLPVYGLLIAALYPPGAGHPFAQGMLLAGMYVFGTVAALACAAVLGRTLFRGPRIPLLIEMPPYRVPHWPSVVRSMTEESLQFVKRAGTIILLCSVGMWTLLSFPRGAPTAPAVDAERTRLEAAAAAGEDEAAAELAALAAREASRQAQGSYAGRLGRLLEPAIAPLGFDWKIGIGVVGAFAAREVFVSTMGVVYGLGEDVDEDSPALRERLREARWPDGRAVFTPLACLSLMVFFALACQCLSTLAVTRRETRTWRWPLFMFVYMTLLAWCTSFAVYQGGRLLGFV